MRTLAGDGTIVPRAEMEDSPPLPWPKLAQRDHPTTNASNYATEIPVHAEPRQLYLLGVMLGIFVVSVLDLLLVFVVVKHVLSSDRTTADDQMSSRRFHGRVFGRYVTVDYLRTIWWVNVWGVMVTRVLLFVLVITKVVVYFWTQSAPAVSVYAVHMGVVLIGVSLLFELMLFRIGLETLSVVFDMAHDIRTVADSVRSTPERAYSE